MEDIEKQEESARQVSDREGCFSVLLAELSVLSRTGWNNVTFIIHFLVIVV
jgi:hypothetical protein